MIHGRERVMADAKKNSRLEVLVLDDEESIRWVIKKTFGGNEYKLHFAESAEQALQILAKYPIAFAVVDINLPGADGLHFLEQQSAQRPELLISIITGQGSMHNAITAMKLGAFDFLTKPFDIEELEALFKQSARAVRQALKPNRALESGAAGGIQEGAIIGASRAMAEIFKRIGQVSDSDVSVLILGESGTGKELIARALHQHSRRSGEPFLAVNCAAIPRELLEAELFGHEQGAFTGAREQKAGRLEAARGGTLFLDEIGDMSLELQAKLLRVLQEKEFQRVGGLRTLSLRARVVAATNQALERAVADGRFRADLFYRINTVTLCLPPLSERAEDIPPLVHHFLRTTAERLGTPGRGITPAALSVLVDYSWPGNVRELENVVKSLLIMSRTPVIDAEDLPRNLVPETHSPDPGKNFEKSLLHHWQGTINDYCEKEQQGLLPLLQSHLERPLILQVLARTRWNQLKTASVLGINRNTLRSKMQALGIRKEPAEIHHD